MNSSATPNQLQFDILIIGSGAAGLTLALKAADFSRVAVLSKGDLNQGATFYAQGGIAAVLDETDSIESHVADTLSAGVGLCHEDIVEHIVAESAEAVKWLVEQGVPFTTKESFERGENISISQELSSLHLTQEGGHSNRRIIHATDATGKAVFETLSKTCPGASKHRTTSRLYCCRFSDTNQRRRLWERLRGRLRVKLGVRQRRPY